MANPAPEKAMKDKKTDASKTSAVRRLVRTSVAVSTPFDARDQIDWKTFAQHAKWLFETGATSVTLFGTTGEGASVAQAERHEAFEHLSKAGVQPASTIFTARALAAKDIANDCKSALQCGCGAVLLAPPVTVGGIEPEGVLGWYRSVLDHIGGSARNIILYNIPPVTGVTLTPDVVSALREGYPEIVTGVKVSSTDWDYMHHLLTEHRDLAIIASHEAHLARAMSLGAAGTISGLANFQPALIAGIANGHDDERVVDLVKLVLSFPPVPALKFLLAYSSGQEQWSRMRAPMVQLPTKMQNSLRDAYRNLFPGTAGLAG